MIFKVLRSWIIPANRRFSQVYPAPFPKWLTQPVALLLFRYGWLMKRGSLFQRCVWNGTQGDHQRSIQHSARQFHRLFHL